MHAFLNKSRGLATFECEIWVMLKRKKINVFQMNKQHPSPPHTHTPFSTSLLSPSTITIPLGSEVKDRSNYAYMKQIQGSFFKKRS